MNKSQEKLLENYIRRQVRKKLREEYDPGLLRRMTSIIENLFDRYFRGQIKDPGKIKNFCTHLAQDLMSEFTIS